MFVLNWKDCFETQNQFFHLCWKWNRSLTEFNCFWFGTSSKKISQISDIWDKESFKRDRSISVRDFGHSDRKSLKSLLINHMPHGKNLKKISGHKKVSEKIFETLQFEITLSKTFENVVKIIIRYLSLDGCHSECHPLNLHSLYVSSWKTSQHNHTRSNRPSKLTFSYFRQNYNARSEMCRALWTEGSQDQYWRCGCG